LKTQRNGIVCNNKMKKEPPKNPTLSATISKYILKIEDTDVKKIPLTHIYMSAHFPGLIQ
jgi:hypothetical protein